MTLLGESARAQLVAEALARCGRFSDPVEREFTAVITRSAGEASREMAEHVNGSMQGLDQISVETWDSVFTWLLAQQVALLSDELLGRLGRGPELLANVADIDPENAVELIAALSEKMTSNEFENRLRGTSSLTWLNVCAVLRGNVKDRERPMAILGEALLRSRRELNSPGHRPHLLQVQGGVQHERAYSAIRANCHAASPVARIIYGGNVESAARTISGIAALVEERGASLETVELESWLTAYRWILAHHFVMSHPHDTSDWASVAKVLAALTNDAEARRCEAIVQEVFAIYAPASTHEEAFWPIAQRACEKVLDLVGGDGSAAPVAVLFLTKFYDAATQQIRQESARLQALVEQNQALRSELQRAADDIATEFAVRAAAPSEPLSASSGRNMDLPASIGPRAPTSRSSWSGGLGQLGHAALTLLIIVASCYGPIHANQEHRPAMGWGVFLVPPLAWYWAAEGMLWHSDGVGELCRTALACNALPELKPATQWACESDLRSKMSLIPKSARVELQDLYLEWADMDCEHLQAMANQLRGAEPPSAPPEGGSTAL